MFFHVWEKWYVQSEATEVWEFRAKIPAFYFSLQRRFAHIQRETFPQSFPQTVLYSEQRNWKQKVLRRNKRIWKNDRVRFRLNIDVRKEKEHSWLNAIKTKIAFVKGRLNFSSKSTTAAKVHLMECPLDNWLKNNYITVDMIYCLRSVLVSGIFYQF